MIKGIDVSCHQGIINWEKVNTDFAIIRLGYGDDDTRQDDKNFVINVNGCINNKIPYGVYIYSYATNLKGEASIESEIQHTLRLIKNLSIKPFCVYIDMEDDSTTYLGRDTLTNFAKYFCEEITKNGYKAGVYANQNWFSNYINANELQNYSLWVARYSENKPEIGCNYDIWQYSEQGVIEGIKDNKVDMNYMLNDIRGGVTPQPTPQPTPTQVNVYYRTKTRNYGWLSEVRNLEDYAGYNNDEILCVAIGVDKGRIEYRGTTVSGKQFGWVTGYDINDFKNGYAGNDKDPLALIEVMYYTPDDIRPFKCAKYKVNNYSWQIDLYKKNGMDGYAGAKGVPMTKFQIVIE